MSLFSGSPGARPRRVLKIIGRFTGVGTLVATVVVAGLFTSAYDHTAKGSTRVPTASRTSTQAQATARRSSASSGLDHSRKPPDKPAAASDRTVNTLAER